MGLIMLKSILIKTAYYYYFNYKTIEKPILIKWIKTNDLILTILQNILKV